MTVTIDRDSVVKVYHRANLDIEVTKAQLIHEASLNAGFIAPAVLDVDQERCSIRYRRLDCALSLGELIADPSLRPGSVLDVIGQAAASLGAIHGIRPPAGAVSGERSPLLEKALRRRSDSDTTGDMRYLQHGDFGFTNIFVDSTGRVTVIDPSPNTYTSIHALNVDVPELDLAILMSHFIGRSSSPKVLARCVTDGSRMVEAAIGGYESAGATIDLLRLHRFTRSGIDAYIDYRTGLGGSRGHKALRYISAALSRNIP